LNPVFRYSHWAGISDYTSPFGVAVTYVVIRQLVRPGHCDLLDLQAGTPYPKVTGPICRVPLTTFKSDTPSPLQRGAPVSVLGTDL